MIKLQNGDKTLLYCVLKFSCFYIYNDDNIIHTGNKTAGFKFNYMNKRKKRSDINGNT